MSGDDTARLITTLRSWMTAGYKAAIATVIETWGSAPRRMGAHLIIREDGLFEGSVSGGCVEGDVIAEAADVIAENSPKRLEYGVADARAWEVGLACGGRIAVHVQPVSEAGFSPALAEHLADALARGESVQVVTGEDGISREGDGEGFVRLYEPAGRLMIVGAVHIAQALVPMAELLGYTPLVVDPRGSFAAAERFQHIAVDPRWPDEALADWKPDSASAVVALTHDPKLDDPALIAALNAPAFYIAALGSRKNQAIRRERLATAGFDDAALNRIHGPAGLAIGAANPAEIALSIAAQMIATRRGA